MGEALATAVFEESDFVDFARALRQQRAIIAERMFYGADCRNDPWSRDPQLIGREKEYVLVHAGTGRPAHIAPDVLPGLAAFESELGPWNVEACSTVVSQHGKPFSQIAGEEAEQLAVLSAMLARYPAYYGSFGVVPSITEADLDNIMDDPRYIALMRQFDASHGHYNIHISVPGFATLFMSGHGIAPEAATTTCQLHRDLSVRTLVNRMNTRQWISPVLVGLTGWGGHACGRLLCRGELRHLIFPDVVRNRGRRHETDWLRDPMDPIDRTLREPILLPRVRDEPTTELREIRLQMGTAYPPSVRLVLTKDGLRTEGRDRPAAATIRDTSADDALELALEEHEGPSMARRISRGLDFTVYQENLASAARFGATAPIRMMRQGKLYWTTPAEFVRDHSDDLHVALVVAGINDGEAVHHLGPAIRRAERDFTPTDWPQTEDQIS